MNITRKDILSFVIRLVPLVAVLCLFTDMVGVLFVDDDYTMGASACWKIVLFITAFTSAFLVGSNVLKWPVRQLAYIGYPLYLLAMAVCGVFSASHNLLGYKIALIAVPCVAQVFKWYGKGWLRRYLRMVTRLSGGRLMSRKGMAIVAGTVGVAVLLLTGVHSLRGIFHFNFREFVIEAVTIAPKPEKPIYNPEFKDRRDPYRNYPQIFNDLNDIQLVAAHANGTPHTLTIEELEVGKYGLQRVETNKLYKVDPLLHSAPYLMPKAKDFLDELGEAFQDSLYNRGYDRRHRFIVTSVYRTEDHIRRLRRSGNVNASKNSCHQYGTTVDITYVRFDKPEEHRANDPKLLQLLMQTVYDMHRAGRCYVKYERKQSCLHITVR